MCVKLGQKKGKMRWVWGESKALEKILIQAYGFGFKLFFFKLKNEKLTRTLLISECITNGKLCCDKL